MYGGLETAANAVGEASPSILSGPRSWVVALGASTPANFTRMSLGLSRARALLAVFSFSNGEQLIVLLIFCSHKENKKWLFPVAARNDRAFLPTPDRLILSAVASRSTPGQISRRPKMYSETVSERLAPWRPCRGCSAKAVVTTRSRPPGADNAHDQPGPGSPVSAPGSAGCPG